MLPMQEFVSMKFDDDFGVLLLAYRRSTSLNDILVACSRAGIKRIYINIDGPKSSSHSDFSDRKRVLDFCKNWENEHPEISIRMNIREENLGCSASVLQSIDWAFVFERHLIVLEDDCVPDVSFFNYCRDSLSILTDDNNVMLSCGSQFAPLYLTKKKWMISKYALTWGWATTRTKWLRLKDYMQLEEKNRNSRISLYEQVYWRAGARRARYGFVDVWDTILVNAMIENGLTSILPAMTLVSNKGDDAFATHTHDDSTWLHQQIGFYSRSWTLQENHDVDDWLKRNFYKIRFRHLFSTIVSRVLDEIFSKRRKVSHLSVRWQ